MRGKRITKNISLVSTMLEGSASPALQLPDADHCVSKNSSHLLQSILCCLFRESVGFSEEHKRRIPTCDTFVQVDSWPAKNEILACFQAFVLAALAMSKVKAKLRQWCSSIAWLGIMIVVEGNLKEHLACAMEWRQSQRSTVHSKKRARARGLDSGRWAVASFNSDGHRVKSEVEMR